MVDVSKCKLVSENCFRQNKKQNFSNLSKNHNANYTCKAGLASKRFKRLTNQRGVLWVGTTKWLFQTYFFLKKYLNARVIEWHGVSDKRHDIWIIANNQFLLNCRLYTNTLKWIYQIAVEVVAITLILNW